MSQYYQMSFKSQSPSDLPGTINITHLYDGFNYNSGFIKSKPIGDNGIARSYIQFQAEAGDVVTLSAFASSEYSYDYGGAAVTQSTDYPSSGYFMYSTGSDSTFKPYTYTIPAAGTYYLHFYYCKDASGSENMDALFINSISLPYQITSYTLDFSTKTPTNLPLSINISQLYAGFDYNSGYIKSKTISDNGVTRSYIQFDAKKGSKVVVRAYASCEDEYDMGLAYVTKSSSYPTTSAFMQIWGSTSSAYYTYTIPATGTYYLHLVYCKDSEGSDYQDCIFIQSIELPVASIKASYNTLSLKETAMAATTSGSRTLALTENIYNAITTKSLVLNEKAYGAITNNLALTEKVYNDITSESLLLAENALQAFNNNITIKENILDGVCTNLALKETCVDSAFANLALKEICEERPLYTRYYLNLLDSSDTRANITYRKDYTMKIDEENNWLYYVYSQSKTWTFATFILPLRKTISSPTTPVVYSKIGLKIRYANIDIEVRTNEADLEQFPKTDILTDWIDVEFKIKNWSEDYTISLGTNYNTMYTPSAQFFIKDVYIEREDIKVDLPIREMIVDNIGDKAIDLTEKACNFNSNTLLFKEHIVYGSGADLKLSEDAWDGDIYTRFLDMRDKVQPHASQIRGLDFKNYEVSSRYMSYEVLGEQPKSVNQNYLYFEVYSDTPMAIRSEVILKVAPAFCREGSSVFFSTENLYGERYIYYNNELVEYLGKRFSYSSHRINLVPGVTDIKIVLLYDAYVPYASEYDAPEIYSVYLETLPYSNVLLLEEKIYPIVKLPISEQIVSSQLIEGETPFFDALYFIGRASYDKENMLYYNENTSLFDFYIIVNYLKRGDLHFDLNVALEENQKLTIYALSQASENPEKIIYFEGNTTNGWQHITMSVYSNGEPNLNQWLDNPEACFYTTNKSGKEIPLKAIQIKNLMLNATIESEAKLRITECYPIVGYDAVVMAENIWDKIIPLNENVLAATLFDLKCNVTLKGINKFTLKEYIERKSEGYKELLLEETVKAYIKEKKDLRLYEEIKLRPGEFEKGDLTLALQETIHMPKLGFNQLALNEKVFNDFDIRYNQQIYSRSFEKLSKVQESGGRATALSNYAREPEVFIYKALKISAIPIYSNANRIIIDLRGKNHNMRLKLPKYLNYYDGSIGFQDSPNYTMEVFTGVALPTTYVTVDAINFIQVYAFDDNNNKKLLPITSEADGCYYYDIPSTNTYRIEVFLADTLKIYPPDTILSMPLTNMRLINMPILNQTLAIKEEILAAPTQIRLDEYAYEERARRINKYYNFTAEINDTVGAVIKTTNILSSSIVIAFETNKPVKPDDFYVIVGKTLYERRVWPAHIYSITYGDEHKFYENVVIMDGLSELVTDIQLLNFIEGLEVTKIHFVASYEDLAGNTLYNVRKFLTDSLYLREKIDGDGEFKKTKIIEWVVLNGYYEHDTNLFALNEVIATESYVLEANTCGLRDYIIGNSKYLTLPVKESVQLSLAPINGELFEYINGQFVPYTNNPVYFMNGFIFVKAGAINLKSKGCFDYSVIRSAVDKNKYVIAFDNPKTKQLDFYYFESYNKLDDFRPYINYLMKEYAWYGIELSAIKYIGILLEEAIIQDLAFKWLLIQNTTLPITEDVVARGKVIDIDVIKYRLKEDAFYYPDRVIPLPFATIVGFPASNKIWADINFKDINVSPPTAANPRIMEQIVLETNFRISSFKVNGALYSLKDNQSGDIYHYYILERPIECLTMTDTIEIQSSALAEDKNRTVIRFSIYYRDLPRAKTLRLSEEVIQPYGKLFIKENILEKGLRAYFPLKEFALYQTKGINSLFIRERALTGNEIFDLKNLTLTEVIDAALTKNSLLLLDIVRSGEVIKDTLELQEIVKPLEDKALLSLKEIVYDSKFKGVDGKVMLEVIK